MGELEMDFFDRIIMEEHEKQQRKYVLKNKDADGSRNMDNIIPNHDFHFEFLQDTKETKAS